MSDPAAPSPESSGAAAKPPAGKEDWKQSLKKLNVVDVLLGLAAIGLVFTFLLPRWADHERQVNEGEAIGHVQSLGLAEKQFHDRQADKRYAGTFLELAAAGFDLGGDIEGGTITQAGFVFRVGLLDGAGTRFYILAQPVRFGETGSRSFYIDDTGVLRGSPGPVVGPAFPEVS